MRQFASIRVRLPVTPGTVARQAPLSLGSSRQGCWGGAPPGDLPDPGVEPASLYVSLLAGGFLTTSATWGAHKEEM